MFSVYIKYIPNLKLPFSSSVTTIGFSKCLLKLEKLGCLAGSVGRVCGSSSQGCDFKPHIGCGAYLKNKVK